MNILIPTDFSDCSLKALQYAFDVFGSDAKRFIILHSYHMEHKHSSMLVNLEERLKDEAQKSIDSIKSWVKKRQAGKNHEIIYLVKGGEFMFEVEDVISSYQIKWIVMGTSGASGLKEKFIGSNTARLATSVGIPVIAVPENYIAKPIQKLLYATDYRKFNDEAALTPLLYFSQNPETHLTILHAGTTKESANLEMPEPLKEINQKFGSERVKFLWKLNPQVEEVIHQTVSESEIDLVVLISRKEGFFYRLGHPSISKKVSFHCQVPLLLLHD